MLEFKVNQFPISFQIAMPGAMEVSPPKALEPVGRPASIWAVSMKQSESMRRGWYLGEPGFGDKLRGLLKVGGGDELARDPAYRQHDESEAERLLSEGKKNLGLPAEMDGLAKLRKGDERKILIAALIKGRTSVGNAWVAQRLCMGHPSSVSRLIKDLKGLIKGRSLLEELERKLEIIE